MGVASNPVDVGDILAVLDGCDMPTLLRRMDGQQTSRFIGEAYVHGMMDGEAVADAEREGWEKVIFTIR